MNTLLKTVTETSPLDKERWVYVKAKVEGNFESVLAEVVNPFVQQLQADNLLKNFIFKKDGENEELLAFFFHTSITTHQTRIKEEFIPALEAWAKRENIADGKAVDDVCDFFIFHYITQNHTPNVSEVLLSACSSVASQLVGAGEEWEIESAVEAGIPMHLTLMQSAGLSLDELFQYFDYKFGAQFALLDLDKSADGDASVWQKAFKKSLENNFQEQKANLVGYCEYILDMVEEGESFDEPWLNQWVEACQKGALVHLEMKEQDRLYPCDNNINYKGGPIPESTLEKWEQYEVYSDFINHQLLHGPDFVLVLYYTLRRSLETMTH